MSKVAKHIYRGFRAVLFAAIITVAALYFIIYSLVSMPALQKRLVAIAEREVSTLVGSDVKIGRLEIYPFNEVRLSDVQLYEPSGHKEISPCVSIGQLGAGIDLMELFSGKVVFTYAELTRVDARISKATSISDYNIQFLINAFKPKKDKEKSPNINLNIRNIVIRKLNMSYDLMWLHRKAEGFDPAHLKISNFRADIAIPSLDTSPFAIETKVRRIAFILNNKLDVTDLSFSGSFSENSLSLRNFKMKLPDSSISLNDLSVTYKPGGDLVETIRQNPLPIKLNALLTPSDFNLFLSELSEYKEKWNLNVAGDYNIMNVSDLSLHLQNEELGFKLQADGNLYSITVPSQMTGQLNVKKLSVTSNISELATSHLRTGSDNLKRILSVIGAPALDLTGMVKRNSVGESWLATLKGELMTDAGNLSIDANGQLTASNLLNLNGNIFSEGFEIGRLAGTQLIGRSSLDLNFDLSHLNKNPDGSLELVMADIESFTGKHLNLTAFAEKIGDRLNVNVSSDSESSVFVVDAEALLTGGEKQLIADLDISRFDTELVGLRGSYSGAVLSGKLTTELEGTDIDDIQGIISGDHLGMSLKDGRSLSVDKLVLSSVILSEDRHEISIFSDYVEGQISGRFKPSKLVDNIRSLTDGLLPSFLTGANNKLSLNPDSRGGNLNVELTIRPLGKLADFFNLPVCPLMDTDVSLDADFTAGTASFDVRAPYLQKGSSSLITDSHIAATIPAPGKLIVEAGTNWPVKNNFFPVVMHSEIYGDSSSVTLGISPDGTGPLTGRLKLDLIASNILVPSLNVILNSSEFRFNDEDWKIERGEVLYSDKKLTVQNVRIAHADQFLMIDGTASDDPGDVLKVMLEDIDLAFIFDTLNINYVNFGGRASGGVAASELFTNAPKVQTVGLKARNFEYGGALLGDADLYGSFDPTNTSIGIKAHIVDPKEYNRVTADVDGRIWIGRDSLSFNFDAHKLNASFLGQFMTAFASDLTATASGKVHLFGTFKDLDLRGHAFADSIRFKLDFTGVYYSGSDSVYLDPGCIRIPSFRVYDRDRHSGIFSGELRHNCLHDATFEFRLKDASRILAYDLPKVSQDDFWWGTVYASGNATIKGIPSLTTIDVDVSTDRDSEFFFALSDTEAAKEYNFLTFTDKTPVSDEPQRIEQPDFISMFRRKKIEEEVSPSNVHIDLRLNATPGVFVTLVMDPVAGDKITGRGYGPLQLLYETENDEPRLYGKYTITEGVYNFSLQDVILKEFYIQDGSTIAFNGDPLAALLDIRASYRVNTSLTDLDKSFAMDRDLNRTNVPVDAILMVDGPLDAPEISFDLDLPTLTDETVRKVRSIISTNDMMSRQILYLLALNRFYTPEYMNNSSGSGTMLTSVASSTISSQLGNALSQLTDKLSVMPSFRSEKGDFSDLEMDVGLSSRLLNNRLLINGNFGYRDRTTSTTTFVGDFDVQYILNRRGSFRLKAYNHFNDQNYYLRQALTTQGIGVEFRHDFNNLFKRRRRSVVVPDSDARDIDIVPTISPSDASSDN